MNDHVIVMEVVAGLRLSVEYVSRPVETVELGSRDPASPPTDDEVLREMAERARRRRGGTRGGFGDAAVTVTATVTPHGGSAHSLPIKADQLTDLGAIDRPTRVTMHVRLSSGFWSKRLGSSGRLKVIVRLAAGMEAREFTVTEPHGERGEHAYEATWRVDVVPLSSPTGKGGAPGGRRETEGGDPSKTGTDLGGPRAQR